MFHRQHYNPRSTLPEPSASHAGPRDGQGRTFAEYVAERIGDAIFSSGRSINEVAEACGINHMTLRRSLDGRRLFNVDDVACLAVTLGLTPAELMDADGFRPVS